MRNLNEYKAEILLRSEKRIKAKRERRIKIFAVVLPLCAALVFGGIIMIPEMLFAGFDGAETEKAEMADGTGNPQLFRYVEFTVNGEFTDAGFLANGVKYIAAGMEIDLYSADFCQKGLIYGIENQSE